MIGKRKMGVFIFIVVIIVSLLLVGVLYFSGKFKEKPVYKGTFVQSQQVKSHVASFVER